MRLCQQGAQLASALPVDAYHYSSGRESAYRPIKTESEYMGDTPRVRYGGGWPRIRTRHNLIRRRKVCPCKVAGGIFSVTSQNARHCHRHQSGRCSAHWSLLRALTQGMAPANSRARRLLCQTCAACRVELDVFETGC